MPFSRFTKVIIDHFLSQHKSLYKLHFQHYHTIKDDGTVSRLKLVRIREDYQEYILHILDMMLNDKIKQLESNQMFIKYSTGHIPPRRADAKNRSRGTSEGTGRIPGVPDESIVISSTLSEGNEKKDNDGDADDEGDDHISNIQDTDDEDAETKS
nr:hypothetical protein [Tanacetum cinerariifolium]